MDITNYARGLFEIGLEEGLKQLKEKLGLFVDTINENSDIKVFFLHPEVSIYEKKRVLDDVRDILGEEITNFLFVLLDDDVFQEIGKIYDKFEEMVENKLNITNADVITVIPLNESEKAKIVDLLSRKFQKRITLREYINIEIIGGIIIKVGDIVINGSILNTLKKAWDI